MRARLVEKEGGKPHPKSVLGRLLVKHGINPDASPIPVKKKPEQEAATVCTRKNCFAQFGSTVRSREFDTTG